MKKIFALLVLLAASVSAQTVTVVSAATYTKDVSRGTIVAIFAGPGLAFTDKEAVASSLPLPTSLSGVTIDATVDFYRGHCQILAAFPTQVNAILPDDIPIVATQITLTITITRGTAGTITKPVALARSAPGIFTKTFANTEIGAYLWFVVHTDGHTGYYGPGELPPTFEIADLYLLLYGTGMHESRAELRLIHNGFLLTYLSIHSVPSGYPGVWQMGFRVPVDHWVLPSIGTVRFFADDGSVFDSQTGWAVFSK